MSVQYTIVVQEPLDSEWADWFGGLHIRLQEDGTTALMGMISDQAALYGILSRARDLNLTLIAVTCTSPLTDQS